jgi:hypothetical protein
MLLLCAAGKSPTEIAEFLFCSRWSVYRIAEVYLERRLHFDELEEDGSLRAPVSSSARRTSILFGKLQTGAQHETSFIDHFSGNYRSVELRGRSAERQRSVVASV